MTRALLLASGLLMLAAPAAAQYGFDWEAGDRGALTEIGWVTTFHTDVINTGSQADTYRVSYLPTMPELWFSSLCEGTFCYAPYPITTQFEFSLAPGDTNSIGVNMTPVTNPGWGVAMVTVTSLGNPALTRTLDFTVLSDSLDVLVVDDDAAGDPGPYFDAALAGTGLLSAVWKSDTMGLLAATDLSGFATVLWAAGDDPSALSVEDRTALDEYVRAGGRLYMSGTEIAYDLANPTSLPLISWMQTVLGIQYVADDAGATAVTGVAGDPLGDGLALALTGGDGAGNNLDPDLVATANGSAVWAEYAPGDAAGVRHSHVDGRVVFTGFAFEGVATATQRQDLLAAIMQWLANSGPSAAGDAPAMALIGAPRAAPNPFNPQTSILFEIGGRRDVDAAVVIHDLRGRAVRRLFRGPLSPGSQRLLWNGRDDAGRGLPSGLYLARVRAGDQTAAIKLTLAK